MRGRGDWSEARCAHNGKLGRSASGSRYHGVPARPRRQHFAAVRIYRAYGADAVPLVSANPYCLARDIVGIGFKSADLIAERLGIAKTAMIRARAGIEYALMEAVADGHCGLPEDELLTRAEKLLEIARPT